MSETLPIPSIPRQRGRVVVAESVWIPEWIDDLESFRRWADSPDFPDDGRISFLEGEIWVDVSMEQLFTHNAVKSELARVLHGLAKTDRQGYFFTDGVRLSHVAAELSTVPDGLFVSNLGLDAGRVEIRSGRVHGHTEIVGSPDIIIEIVSDSSVEKDTQHLPQLYHRANITEYWLIDARTPDVSFTIGTCTSDAYARSETDWQHSAILNREFRFVQETDPRGYPDLTLETRLANSPES